jgi:glycosyltransferase involved in cell wall biosynthesis
MSGLPKRGRARVCAPLPPEYDRESGSRRIYHMVEFLLEAGWQVAFVCENAPPDSRHLRHLRQLGVATYVGFGERTQELIEAGSFDLALFAFWQLAEQHADLVRRLSAGTRIVVDSVDLHWLRNARRAFGRGTGAAGGLDGDFARELVGEVNTYAQADAVLTVSTKEAGLIHDMIGEAGLAWAVPDWDDTPPSPIPFEERRGMLFVGNFRHPPNLDAVQFLCGEILPLVPRKLRLAHPLSIVGNGLDAKVEAAVAGCDGVRLVGWVPSLTPYLHAARAAVVPLRYGAGTKRKLIQALLARTPAVSTSVGAEGIDLVSGRHLLLADDARGLARALERVLTDAELWSELGVRGRRQTLRLHGRAPVRARLVEVLAGVLKRPQRLAALVGGVKAPDARAEAVAAVQRAVASALPTGANVLVISRGDPELVRLPERAGRHFPATKDGRYAGFHPADSATALRELDARRGEADYLLIPASSFWWLDFYSEFAEVLNSRHERVWSDADCVIYRLAPRRAAPVPVALAPTLSVPAAPEPESAGLKIERVRRSRRAGVQGGLLN